MSEFVLPDEVIASLIVVLSDIVVLSSDFPFDETERSKEKYATCELPEEAARVTKYSEDALCIAHTDTRSL